MLRDIAAGKKRLMTLAAVGAVVTVVCAIVLVGLSNRILKYGLEKAVGEHLRVESISLGWEGVGASGVRILSGGRVVASARNVFMRASILNLLRKSYSISSLVIDEPVVTIDIGEDGNAKPRSRPDQQSKEPGKREVPPIQVKHVIVRNGRFSFKDTTWKGPNAVAGESVNLRLENVSYPLRNSVTKAEVEGVFKGDLFSGSLSLRGTVNPVTFEGDINCEGKNIAALSTNGRDPGATAESIGFRASSAGIPANPLVLSNVVMKAPFYRMEMTKKGEIASPLPGKSEKKAPAGETGKEKIRLLFKNVAITGGTLLYLDDKVPGKPYPVKATDINATLARIPLPFDNMQSSYDVTGKIPGKLSTGLFKMTGRSNFKTRDTNAKVSVENLDLTTLKPYIEKKGDADVTRGTVNMNMDLDISHRRIHAPTKTVIRNLEFAREKGVGGLFMGVPRAMVVKLLKTGNNEINLDFTVEGDMDNPRFNFRETLIKRFTVTIAQKLGISALQVGETVVQQGGRVLKNIGNGLQRIFR